MRAVRDVQVRTDGFIIYKFSSLVEFNYNTKRSLIKITIASLCSTLLNHIVSCHTYRVRYFKEVSPYEGAQRFCLPRVGPK